MDKNSDQECCYNTCCREPTLRLYMHKTSQLLSLKMDTNYWTITFQLESKRFDVIKILHVFHSNIRLQTHNIIAWTALLRLSAALTWQTYRLTILKPMCYLWSSVFCSHSSSRTSRNIISCLNKLNWLLVLLLLLPTLLAVIY